VPRPCALDAGASRVDESLALANTIVSDVGVDDMQL